VACCFDCNSRKQNGDALGFLRDLYRDGLLGPEEHARRRQAVEDLRAGRLLPSVKPANPGIQSNAQEDARG
jgi:hypothetical protein